MVKPERVLIGCAPKEKNKDNSYLETEYLFRTLNKFGGTLAHAKKLACFIEQPDEILLEVLDELDVNTKIIEPVDKRNPYSHKIRVIEEASKENIDYVVLMDTDILVTGDFANFIEGTTIKVRTGNRTHLKVDDWEFLFDYFKLPFPYERIKKKSEINEAIPYLNTGVMVIPSHHCSALFETWKKFIHQMIDENNNFPPTIKARKGVSEQIALSLTIGETQIPVEFLPIMLNYPLGTRANKQKQIQSLNPILIHYHRNLSKEGKIMNSPYVHINKKIDEINEFLLKNRKIPF